MMRVSIVLVGALATFMALTAESIYGLWYLSSDLVYVILFPQLVCVVYLKEHVNTYGSFAAYVVGCFLRAGGGESILKIPPFIKYPFYDYEQELQLFPFRTFSMVMSFFTLITVSRAASWVFGTGRLPLNWDVFNCFQPDAKAPETVPVVMGAELKASDAAAAMLTPCSAADAMATSTSQGPTPATAEAVQTPSAAASAVASASVLEEKMPSHLSHHSEELTYKSHGISAQPKVDASKETSEVSASKRKRKKSRRSSEGSRKSAQSDATQASRASATEPGAAPEATKKP